MSEEEAHYLQFNVQEQAEGNEEISAAKMFGNSARLFGDNVEQMIQHFRDNTQTREFIDTCVNEKDPGQATSTALQTFVELASCLFEVDDEGLGMIE